MSDVTNDTLEGATAETATETSVLEKLKETLLTVISESGDLISEFSAEAVDEWIAEMKAHLEKESSNTLSPWVKARNSVYLLAINNVYPVAKTIATSVFNSYLTKIIAKIVAKI